MAEDNKKWLIKDKAGRNFGPYDSEKIKDLILNGVLVGTEKIAIFPDGDYLSISKNKIFYDLFLEAWGSSSDKLSEKQRIEELNKIQKEVSFTTTKKKKVEEIVEDEITQILPNQIEFVEEEKRDEDWEEEITVRSKKKKRNNKKTKNIRLLLFALSLALIAILFMPQNKNFLLKPKNIKLLMFKANLELSSVSYPVLENELSVAQKEIQKDTFKSYEKAQNILIGLLEKFGINKFILKDICVVYRELWPYTEKSSHDQRAISRAVQEISKVDINGYHTAICKASMLLMNDKFEAADAVLNSALEERTNIADLYSLKSEVFAEKKEFNKAIAYVQTAKRLNTKWLKYQFLEANYYLKINDYASSEKLLNNILNKYSKHTVSALELAFIETFYFRNYPKAEELIAIAQNSKNPVPREWRFKSLYSLAVINEQRGDYSKALEFSKQAYAINPTNKEVKNLIFELGGEDAINEIEQTDLDLIANGDYYFKNNNFLGAQAEYKAAFELNNKNIQAVLKASHALELLNQSQEAISWLNTGIKVNNKSVDLHIAIAKLYTQQFNFSAAKKHLLTAKKLSKNDYKVFRGIAYLELKRKSWKAAADNATQAIKIYDTDIESHLYLTKAYMGSDNYEDAYRIISRAISLESSNAKAQALYGEVLSLFQGTAIGVSYLTEKILSYPSQLEYRLSLARIYLKDEKYTDAVSVLTSLLKTREDNKTALKLLGEAQIKAGELQAALEAFLQVGTIDPSNPEPLIEIGKLYLGTQKFEKAISEFAKAKKLNPNYPGVYYLSGNAYLQLGNTQFALREASQEKSRNPQMANAYILAGDAYVQERQYMSAIGEYRKAVELRPKDVALYVKMAKAHRVMGNYDVADQMLATATSIESGFPEIYKEAGILLEKRGKMQEAADRFEKYLNLNPNAPDANLVKERIKNLGGSSGY